MTADVAKRSGRLDDLIKELKIKKVQFAEQIGMKPQYVSHLLNQQRPVTISTALKIAQRFKQVNPDWLLYGKGEMFKGEAELNENGKRQAYEDQDPLRALRALLEDHERRIAALEAANQGKE